MGTITLTNIPHFIEQPGRDIIRTVGSLDRMTVPFLGPYNVKPPFAKGSPDTVYPLMFCTGFTERDNGALTELTVNYVGRTDAKGGTFISEFLLSNAASEKELSYSYLNSGIIGAFTPPQSGANISITNWYKTCIVNYVLRYISTTVTYKYCSYPTPYVMPVGQLLQGQPTNPTVTSQYVRFAGSGSAMMTPGPPTDLSSYPGPFGYVGPIIRETSFSSQELIGGWYDCSVTYDARYEVGE
jgi:hypothetical protein